ncbi:hypothetical protein PLESTB_001071700 [Pleodorina starrii]|uniref:Uncharacterized protein n=1 Tax=Pleodorina starrii TaxID=330485 RepID=A0A9W6F4E8_9CHLO|nr:hypothetical protein PLESTB_001071700 [Pleodorina starrii]GLC75039.1 hypothetical protein PLESTF_001586300 [Pleodorina starrii]
MLIGAGHQVNAEVLGAACWYNFANIVAKLVQGMKKRAARLDVFTACKEIVKNPEWLDGAFDISYEITTIFNLLYVMEEMLQQQDGGEKDEKTTAGIWLWMALNQQRIQCFSERYKKLKDALRQIELKNEQQLYTAIMCSQIKSILMVGF